MSDIFLSYKSEDSEKAQKIAEAIEKKGYTVWWDRIIPPGRTFDEVIEEKLDEAKCVVVLWSGKSVKSKWVKTEASEGDRRGILIPVLIEDVRPPLAFRMIEAAKLMDWDGTSLHPEFDLLIQSVGRILGRPAPMDSREPEQKEKEEEERAKKEKEEQEHLYREEEERKELEIKEKEAKEQLQKQKEEEERTKKEKEEQERLYREEEERKELEIKEKEAKEQLQKQKEEKEKVKKEQEEQVRLKGEERTEEKTYNNSIGMKFALIPAGTFSMGSPPDEEGRYKNEGPVHEVTIRKSFYLGIYPVTQQEWQAVMGENPSFFKGEKLPVEQVSWDDVQNFITRLNEKEGSDKYRLPSEAEWEYAARAGTTTRYSFGDHEFELDEHGWDRVTSNGRTHPVGQKKSNPWGLYDMHGNVGEWVQDEYHDSYEGAPTDGRAWEDGSGATRVFRGGSWNVFAGFCRSALRDRGDPGGRRYDLCFRLLKEL